MKLVVDIPSMLERLGIQAKRRGREYWACCPFHEERTPSWQIRDDPDNLDKHGRWRCLGQCHDGGGVIGLVMRLLGFERSGEARTWLRSGGAVEQVSKGMRAVIEGVLRLDEPHVPHGSFRLPAGARFAPFDDWPEMARVYAQSRGLGEEQAERWGLGFAVDGRLAGRIVMPWRDPHGKLGGYTGRAYVPGAVKKYLEPADHEHASKGWVYGEELWPEHAERHVLAVVEGGFDGFAVERAVGIPFGAARGSNLLPGHVARFSTFRKLLLAVDPDGAGERFAEAIEQACGRHAVVKRVEIPKGFDCAKLERRNPRALAEAFRQAT